MPQGIDLLPLNRHFVVQFLEADAKRSLVRGGARRRRRRKRAQDDEDAGNDLYDVNDFRGEREQNLSSIAVL